jgi:ankyrin repeat protein
MTIAKILGEIVSMAPTYAAGESALYCLWELAKDLDFDAIRELAMTLGTQLGYDIDLKEYERPQTLDEFITAETIPGLIRIYAAGFCPRIFGLDNEVRAHLQGADLGLSVFIVFQSLLRRRSLVEHEVLKAYLLAFSLLSTGNLSPASSVSICKKIMDECEVVEGRNASSDYKFGRELLLEMTENSFLGIVAHEIGHNRGDGDQRQLKKLPLDRKHFLEITCLISKLKPAVIALLGKPMMDDDPRKVSTKFGLKIFYSAGELDEGIVNHISLSNNGGPLELREAVIFLYLILCALNIEPATASIAYSPNGFAHLGFLIPSDKHAEFVVRKMKKFDDILLDHMDRESILWLDELSKAGRVGQREEDLQRFWSQNLPYSFTYGGEPDFVTRVDGICSAIRSGMNLGGMTQDQLSALLYAPVIYGDVSVVEMLLSAGATPDAKTETGFPYLPLAGSSLIVSNVNGEKLYFGPTVSDIFTVMEVLLHAGFDINSAVSDNGDTLLIDAAKRSTEAVKFLLAHGADVNGVNKRGESAIFAAVGGRDKIMVLQLIDANADVDRSTSYGYTPLFAALHEGADDVAKLLIESGADAKRLTSNGESALMFATSSTMTKFLLQSGADVNAVSLEGETALMRAASWGGIAVMEALLDAGADVNAMTDMGETALHYALQNPCRRTRLDVIDYLIEEGADVNSQDNDGFTPIMIAAEEYIDTLNGELDNWTPLSYYPPQDERLETIFRSYYEEVERQGIVIEQPSQERRILHDQSLYNSILVRRLLANRQAKPASIDQLAGDDLVEMMFFEEELPLLYNEYKKYGFDPLESRINFEKIIIQHILDADGDVTMTNMEGENPLSLVVDLDPEDEIRILIENAGRQV